MDTNNYLSSFFSNYYGKLIPSINNIKLIAHLIKKYIPHPKIMYHLYSGMSYIDFVLIENGIGEIICLEPDSLSVRTSIEIRDTLKSPNRYLTTFYNINPLSSEFIYSNADVILVSFQSDLSNILLKIKKESKINTLLIIESYTKPLIELNCIQTIIIDDNISIYFYKL
jgi:hypothetical protein